MGKIAKALLFAGVIVGLIMWYMPNGQASLNETQTVQQLLKGMVSTDARATAVEIRTSVETGVMKDSPEIDHAAATWLDQLGLQSAEGIGTWEQHGAYVRQHAVAWQGTSVTLRMIGLPAQSGYATHLVISAKGNEFQTPQIEALQRKIEDALKTKGIVPQFSTCIRGIYSDKLSVDQQEDKIRLIFSALSAQELERMADETVVSVSGYTRLWEPHIKLYDQKMNLQVATHQDTATGGTLITVGTPIITAEY